MPWTVLRREGEERPWRGTVLAVAAPSTAMDLVDLVCSIERVCVLRAFTATAALPLARVGKPDLVLAAYRLVDDLSLPVLRALRSAPETGGIPVFGICDPQDEEARRAMLEAGCRGFLPDPFRAGEFLDLLRAWLPRRAATGASAPDPGPSAPARTRPRSP